MRISLKLLAGLVLSLSVIAYANLTPVGLPATRTLAASYTATYTDLTNATAVTKWYRDGQWLWVDVKVQWTGAGAGATPFTVSLSEIPGSPVIDTSALTGGTGNTHQSATYFGHVGLWFQQGVAWRDVYALYSDTTHVGFAMTDQIMTGSQFSNGDSLNVTFKVPIVGWN